MVNRISKIYFEFPKKKKNNLFVFLCTTPKQPKLTKIIIIKENEIRNKMWTNKMNQICWFFNFYQSFFFFLFLGFYFFLCFFLFSLSLNPKRNVTKSFLVGRHCWSGRCSSHWWCRCRGRYSCTNGCLIFYELVNLEISTFQNIFRHS